MTATLIVFGVLLAALGWLFLGGRGAPGAGTPGPRPGAHNAELEAAERDVQEAASEDEVREWGPGAGKPRPPERL